MWKQEERQHKARDSRGTNIDGELAVCWVFIYVLIIIASQAWQWAQAKGGLT